MKLQNLYKIALTVALGSALVGCSYINSKVDKNPPSQRQQKCSSIKNQLTLPQGSVGMKPQQLNQNPAQDASDMRLYDKYKCVEFEKTNN